MKQGIILVSVVLISFNTFALVAGVSAINECASRITLEAQTEGGKIEPNENRSSFQDADIKINRLRYSYGLGDFLKLSTSNIIIEYGQFSSKTERVGTNLFYPSDSGNYVSLGFLADLVHVADRLFGFYINVTPSSNYNEKKFSNPRIDNLSFGLTSSFNISESIFQKSLIHYGSGDGQYQNSYIAIDTGFGFRLTKLVNFPLVLSSSLFLEADLKDRFDSSYDAVFSAPGETDRIRAFKYGTLLGISAEVTDEISVSFDYLQKLGGYDARSTQISKLGVGYKF